MIPVDTSGRFGSDSSAVIDVIVEICRVDDSVHKGGGGGGGGGSSSSSSCCCCCKVVVFLDRLMSQVDVVVSAEHGLADGTVPGKNGVD